MWSPTEQACREALSGIEATPLWMMLWPPTGFSGDSWHLRAARVLKTPEVFQAVVKHCEGQAFASVSPDVAAAFDQWMLDWRDFDTIFLSRQIRDYVRAQDTPAADCLLDMANGLGDANDTNFR